jgi:hypothetical protein
MGAYVAGERSGACAAFGWVIERGVEHPEESAAQLALRAFEEAVSRYRDAFERELKTRRIDITKLSDTPTKETPCAP